MQFSKDEFRENQYSETRTLRKGVNGILSMLGILFVRLGLDSVCQPSRHLLRTVTFVKIDAMNATL